LIEVPGDPTISDVHKKQFRASHARQRFDVCKNRLVGRTILKRNENVFIHGKNDEIQMTSIEGMTTPKARNGRAKFASLFGFSFFSRHLSFACTRNSAAKGS
jgi:hypothetical protein